jgi:hypothetical protein
MFTGIAAIVSAALALILWLAHGQIHGGVFLTWQTFTLTGLLCFYIWAVTGGSWPRRGAQ